MRWSRPGGQLRGLRSLLEVREADLRREVGREVCEVCAGRLARSMQQPFEPSPSKRQAIHRAFNTSEEQGHPHANSRRGSMIKHLLAQISFLV